MPGRCCPCLMSCLLIGLLSACSPERASVSDPGTADVAASQRPGVEQADGVRLPASLELDALHALRAARRPADDWWRSDAAGQMKRVERLAAAERDARAALIETLGPAAGRSPAFDWLFLPLNDRMPELSSRAQIVIHNLERRFVAAQSGGGAAASFADHLARIRAQLGDATANEYALRASPLAGELRRAELDLSEDEFRDAFALFADIDNAADSRTFMDARGRLRNLLGSERFVRVWSRRDPRFAGLASTATRFELSGDSLLTAYAILIEGEDALIEAVAPQGLTAGRQAAADQPELAAVLDATRRRLAGLVGEHAAEALMLTMANGSGARFPGEVPVRR